MTLTSNTSEQEQSGRATKFASTSATKIVTEELTMEILAQHGIMVPRYSFVANEEDAVEKAKALGFPVVGKIISPQILHKTDVKAVKMGLNSEAEVRQLFAGAYRKLSSQYHVKGVLLEEMVPPGIELIVALQNDPQFGPIIMVGIGGLYTEVFRDVQFRVLPISKQDVLGMIGNLKCQKLLSGFRGFEPINLAMLTDAILRIGNLGTQLADHYESIELNPLIAYSNDYCAVDCKMILKENTRQKAISTAKPDLSYMDLFFDATSVAVFGASPQLGTVGNAILQKLILGNHGKKIFPVNAKGYSKIMGVKAYKHVHEIPERIDLAVVATDLKFVPAIMESCNRKGIHSMVILSGGGKEIGGERAIIEHQVGLLARNYGIRVIGPNCIGILNSKSPLDCIFQGYGKRIQKPPRGQIAFVSQSGTFGAAFLESAFDGLGVSKLVTYGNRTNVDEADLIWYLAHDSETKVIGMYFEGLEDGRKFMDTAKRVIMEHKKPIVVYKNNRTAYAAKQSALHNGSLAGSYEVAKGAFDQVGILPVNSYEELIASLKALSRQPVPLGNRIAMVTNGGGAVVGALDQIESLGLTIAQPSEQTKRAYVEYFPVTYAYGNPCDLTCVATATDFEFAIRKLIEDPNVDIIVAWLVPWFVLQKGPLEEDDILKVLAKIRNEKKPILIGTFSDKSSRGVSKNIEKLGIPVFHSLNTCMTAASTLAKWSKIIGQSKA